LKLSLAQLPRYTPNAVGFGESQDRVDRRVVRPQTGQFFVRQQSNMGVEPGFAQTQQGRRGHDGVAKPVDATHQNPLRTRSAGWEVRRHGELRLPAPAGSAVESLSGDRESSILRLR